jgi:hypothetical protein
MIRVCYNVYFYLNTSVVLYISVDKIHFMYKSLFSLISIIKYILYAIYLANIDIIQYIEYLTKENRYKTNNHPNQCSIHFL